MYNNNVYCHFRDLQVHFMIIACQIYMIAGGQNGTDIIIIHTMAIIRVAVIAAMDVEDRITTPISKGQIILENVVINITCQPFLEYKTYL